MIKVFFQSLNQRHNKAFAAEHKAAPDEKRCYGVIFQNK